MATFLSATELHRLFAIRLGLFTIGGAVAITVAISIRGATSDISCSVASRPERQLIQLAATCLSPSRSCSDSLMSSTFPQIDQVGQVRRISIAYFLFSLPAMTTRMALLGVRVFFVALYLRIFFSTTIRVASCSYVTVSIPGRPPVQSFLFARRTTWLRLIKLAL